MSKRQKKWERTVPWGEALQLAAWKAPGGLKGQVERIQAAVGKSIGSRNTFAKLFELDAPPDAQTDPIDAERACYLVAALGLDVNEWGLGDVVLPAAFDPERVLELVGGDGAGRLTGGSSSAPSPAKQIGTEGEEWAARDSNPEPAESMPEAA